MISTRFWLEKETSCYSRRIHIIQFMGEHGVIKSPPENLSQSHEKSYSVWGGGVYFSPGTSCMHSTFINDVMSGPCYTFGISNKEQI